ncbi:MAG: hypothetical protein CL840_20580 [Crocinitomicaceae bacterium]|nr:hypothetical protein [Crocinitomicaceae bacterium]
MKTRRLKQPKPALLQTKIPPKAFNTNRRIFIGQSCPIPRPKERAKYPLMLARFIKHDDLIKIYHRFTFKHSI